MQKKTTSSSILEQLTVPLPQGVSLAIEEEYKAERKKHDSALHKLLAISNPQLGEEWLEEIKKH